MDIGLGTGAFVLSLICLYYVAMYCRYCVYIVVSSCSGGGRTLSRNGR